MNALKTMHFDAFFHIMIDIECTGLGPGCQVLQIAAVPVITPPIVYPALDSDLNQYASVESNAQFGLEQDEETMNWWSTQEEELRNKVFGGTAHIVVVLNNLSNYIGHIEMAADKLLGKQLKIWAKPASFDFKILEYAYTAVGLPIPWYRHQLMCMQTLGQLLGPVDPSIEFIGTRHNAFNDASYQAKCLTEYFNMLRGYEI